MAEVEGVRGPALTLRIRRPAARRPFRVPGSVRGVPVLPVIAVGMIATLLGFSIRGLMIAGAG